MSSGVLLDTHIVLWLRTEPEKLTAGERRVIDTASRRLISSVTFWEFGILLSLKRIADHRHLFDTPDGYETLPIDPVHCKALATLPRHHRDPFDRMLVAQAQSEQVALLTRDRRLSDYAPQATILRLPEA
jgi:PIN domain nuclease of toxin-antitoxin system